MSSIFLWNLTNRVEVVSEFNESVLKISNIASHLYVLTHKNKLYHGVVESVKDDEQVCLIEHEGLRLKDIHCSDKFIYVVDVNGKVFKYTENLEVVKEIMLIDDSKMCCHGYTGTKFKMKVDKISVGVYGYLFITENGHLWGMGNMHQIGLNSDSPKKVTFFDGRFVYSASVGDDFAIAIVSKQLSNEDTDSDVCEDEVLVSTCPLCMSTSQLTSPVSQNSLSDMCPLGIPIPVSYDIETTSTSSKNDSLSPGDTRKSTANQDNNETTDNNSEKTERNIIFRNTEAAKEFLTRQLSWMSSAGEEYLVECTEKPTRIIRENVSNMASLVYEGVKTVGDKVATLSRHVSGSSDTNDVLECVEDIHLPRVTSKDEFMWSLSQCTSEKDLSEHGVEERTNVLLKNGSNLLNSEVWTWGNIVHGQLGIGDIIKRERPMIITKLSNIGAHKISVQSYHAAVLTLDGRAFLWGRNDYHQVTVESDVDQSSPKLFNTSSNERIKDLGCGTYHTSLLSYENDLYYIGKQAENVVRLDELCDKAKRTEVPGEETSRDALLSTSNFTVMNKLSLSHSFTTEILVNEQNFVEFMLIVHVSFIKQLQKKTTAGGGDLPLYENLCKNYIELLQFTAANVHSLIEYSNKINIECDIVMIKYADEHLYVYKKYLDILHSIVSMGGFKYISKLVDIPVSLYRLVDMGTLKKDRKNDEIIIDAILIKPFTRLSWYQQMMRNVLKSASPTKTPKIKDALNKWGIFTEDQEQKNREAEMTKYFWTNSGRIIDHLKSPSRRLLRDSYQFPIFLQNASIFSSHGFILLNDIFVHMIGGTSNVHNLNTIWVEPQQDSTNNQYQICLKMPEETIELYTLEAEDKVQWFHALQSAIKNALGKLSAHQPPSVRNATYTFGKSGHLKDAKYAGRWLNAKMHGSGKLEWTDGRVYTGQFSNNQIHGFGRMNTPNISIYEGQWKDNQQNGFGILKYVNGDVYRGYFKDGVSHGHGSLKQGNFTASAASIYIGDWVFGAKSGYGIMHDIVGGYKYLGAWSDNKKHGKGLIVTSDGIYYEGIFNQEVLTGNGLMILEDDTYYEGDFKGIGILGGKGTLTLKSGHTLEGNLTGSWNEGIKVSNGILSLSQLVQVDSSLPKSFNTFCTPVHQKWKALFRYCYQILGVPENSAKNNVKVPDTRKIWQNVAVVISNSHQGGTLDRNKVDRGIENSMNHLDTIPQFGRDTIDSECFKDIKHYVIKAFECPYHPLGSLLGDLTVAYTTTYGGLKPHPLLLSHAVNELHSITKRLYDIVRLLFPALPEYEKQIPLEQYEESDVISCQSLLYPIILPKVHQPLFILYTLKNKQEDIQYWKRLTELNKQPDYTLMAFLSVDEKILQTAVNDQPLSPVSKVKEQHFIEAIETLQLLKTTFSPLEKLSVLRQTFQKITVQDQDGLNRQNRWNMDELFPVFLYVVVRARLLQLGAEIDFMEEFMGLSLDIGVYGIMFTTLKACYQHILKEKVSVT